MDNKKFEPGHMDLEWILLLSIWHMIFLLLSLFLGQYYAAKRQTTIYFSFVSLENFYIWKFIIVCHVGNFGSKIVRKTRFSVVRKSYSMEKAIAIRIASDNNYRDRNKKDIAKPWDQASVPFTISLLPSLPIEGVLTQFSTIFLSHPSYYVWNCSVL